MLIFAIESSCDETAAALVENGIVEVASVVASSKELHEATGGIVPEVAARKQVEFIVPVIDQTLLKAQGVLGYKTREELIKNIDALAVTTGPGLVGSLIIGVEAAKSLSLAWGKPLIPVNHLIGHIYSNWIGIKEQPQFPLVALVVSGGHTDLVFMHDHGKFEYLGGTYDDAAGEAFDKTARLLGLSKYLGGIELSSKAAQAEQNPISGKLPRPLISEDNYDFSFSGLKTAVKRLIEQKEYPVEVVSREFEDAVVDVLVKKTIRAAKEYKAKAIVLGGGVSANTHLRTQLKSEAGDIPVFVPPLKLTGDNAAYIASAAYFNQKYPDLKEIQANPSMGIMDRI